MLVQDIMQSKVITITPETTLPEAMRLINPGPAIKALEAKGYSVRDSWRG